MTEIVPGEMLASKPQIIVMRLSTGTFDPLAALSHKPRPAPQADGPVGSLHNLEMMLIAGALRQELRQGRIS